VYIIVLMQLNCTPTDPPIFRDTANKRDVIEYMSGIVQPDYECWAKGSWQVFLFPFGVATLATYTFALPAVALWWLRKNRNAIKTDQILRAQDLGDDRLSNPRFYDFRQMWQKLYYHYLPGKWYWEFIITTRKMFIAGTSLAFRQVPAYQLAIALLVLFTAYVMHVKHQPYMSHSTRPAVVEEHLKKALTDPLHAKIEADMRDAARKNFRARKRANVFDSANTNKNKNSAAVAVIMHFFDSNTVEAVLLACCVLISLAGIMLESKRFDGDNWYIPQVQHEYLGISVGCLTILIFSFVYFFSVFSLEMSLVFCNDGVTNLFTTRCASKGARKNASTAKVAGGSSKALLSDSSASGTDLAFNPMMMKASAAKNSLKGSDAVAGVVDAGEVSNLDAPTPMWTAVQTSYSILMKQVIDLREELRLAKQNVERASEAPASSGFRGNSKGRQEFRPQQTVASPSGDMPSPNPLLIPSGRAQTARTTAAAAPSALGFASSGKSALKLATRTARKSLLSPASSPATDASLSPT
jgi:hypothetical protein